MEQEAERTRRKQLPGAYSCEEFGYGRFARWTIGRSGHIFVPRDDLVDAICHAATRDAAARIPYLSLLTLLLYTLLPVFSAASSAAECSGNQEIFMIMSDKCHRNFELRS